MQLMTANISPTIHYFTTEVGSVYYGINIIILHAADYKTSLASHTLCRQEGSGHLATMLPRKYRGTQLLSIVIR